MASSSTRSTELEKQLRHFYKIAFSRLYSSNCCEHAQFVTQQFARLLDMTDGQMMETLKPVYWKNNILTIEHDSKLWRELQHTNRNMRRSEKVSSAGDALADVAAVLFKVGRDSEAIGFCESGDVLWKVSMDVYEEEQRTVKQRYTSDRLDRVKQDQMEGEENNQVARKP